VGKLGKKDFQGKKEEGKRAMFIPGQGMSYKVP